MSSLEKRKIGGNLIGLYSFLRRGNREGSNDVFCLVTNVRMHWNSTKLCLWRFRLDIRKIFTVRVVKH